MIKASIFFRFSRKMHIFDNSAHKKMSPFHRTHFKNLNFSKNCRRPGSNRYKYHYSQDFKSCASANSATPAYVMRWQLQSN